MTTINIKPLSVNEAYKGRRYSTAKHSNFQKSVLMMLPEITLPPKPLKIFLEFGFSNSCSDWDNGVKNFVDVLVKKYDFDDREIYEGNVKKVIVKKGMEYVKFRFESMGI